MNWRHSQSRLSAAPLLSFNDPVTNPNLDFTGPIATWNQSPESSSCQKPCLPLSAERPYLPLVTHSSNSSQQMRPASPSGSDLRQLLAARPTSIRGPTICWRIPQHRGSPGSATESPSLTLHWNGNRSVNSISLGLLDRPVDLRGSWSLVQREVGPYPSPKRGGIVSFAPMTTDTLTIRFLAVSPRFSAVPTGPQTVGPASIHRESDCRLACPPSGFQRSTRARRLQPHCRHQLRWLVAAGPIVKVDDHLYAHPGNRHTRRLDQSPTHGYSRLYVPNDRVDGWAPRDFVSTGSAFRVTSLLVGQPAIHPLIPAAQYLTYSVDPGKRTLRIGTGPATYVQVAQNFNPGWVATLNGRTLKAVSLSGWEQGWIVPAGASGVMTMKFEPDQTYRAALLIGGLFLLTSVHSRAGKGDRSRRRPIGPGKAPAIALAGAAALGVFCMGGVLVLSTRSPCCHHVPLGKQRHRGDRGREFQSGRRHCRDSSEWPFSRSPRGQSAAPVEICAVTALCAALSSVIVEEERRRTAPFV